MQDLNPALCTTTPMTVVDKRDNQEYVIQKLADGNCWMMTNLNLGAVELTKDLTPENTNLATTVTAATFNSWKKSTSSQTYTAGEYIPVSGTDSTSQTPYGTLYNYCAASAGTICTSSNSSDAQYDICPKGWRLPTGGSSGEFQALYNNASYNTNAKMRAPYTSGGAAFALAGYFRNAVPVYQGSNGLYWSSTRLNDALMYDLGLSTSNVYPADNLYRYDGYSIRCILNDSRTISDITTMQEMSPQIAAKMNNGDTATLKDSRDGQDYTIAKLADGNVWLLENLRLDISDPTVQAKLTSATTNATDTTLGYLKNGGGTSPYPANGVSSVWSSSAQNSYDMPYIATAYKDDITTNYGSGSGKTGIYYNFCAASAGSYCYTSSTGTGNASQDICPLGWQIPTSEEYKTLSGKYNPTATSINSLQYNLSTPLSGYFYNGKTGNYNLASIFWSSTSRGSGDMFDLAYNATSVIPQNYNTRDYGFNIRCIAK